MQVPVHNAAGQVIDNIELDESVFGIPPNEAVVHQALVRHRANARVGCAETKTRSQVAGSTRKLYRQKHTGFARAGSKRSPTRRGGGIAFGPHFRGYRQAMPKKMRRLALKCVLTAKLAEGELIVIDSFGIEEPRTRQLSEVLKAVGIQSSALLVTADADVNVVKSARNIAQTKTTPAGMLNVLDLLSYKMLLVTVEAVRKVETVWGGQRVAAGVSESRG